MLEELINIKVRGHYNLFAQHVQKLCPGCVYITTTII